MKKCLFYLDNPESELPSQILQSNLDLRYLLIYHDKANKDFVKGINPAIKPIFIDYWLTPSLVEEFLNANPEFLHRAGYGIIFEKYIENILINCKNKELILEKEEGDSSFSWIFDNVFLMSYKSSSNNKIQYLHKYNDHKIFLLTPEQVDFPLYDFMVINRLVGIAYFVSVKVKEPRTIKKDLKFLLKPLTKKIPEPKKGKPKMSQKEWENLLKNSIIEKLKNYCQETKKVFGNISFLCFINLSFIQEPI